MYSVVLASVLIPALEAPSRGGRRGGCGGGGMMYSAGCWGGCYGGYPIYYGCYGGYPIYVTGTCTGMGGGAGMGGGGGGQGGEQGGGGGEGGEQAGGYQGSGSPRVSQEIKELKTSIEQLKKEQTQQRVDLLKMIAEELRSRGTEQALNEIRRDLEALKLRIPGPAAPVPLPMPLPEARPTPVLPVPRTSRIELQVPADALLHVNDEKVDLAARFITPQLEAGQKYYYDFDVSFVRDGKAVNLVKRVTVRAGDVIRLTVEDMHPPRWTPVTGTRASASAPLAGPLPSAHAALAP